VVMRRKKGGGPVVKPRPRSHISSCGESGPESDELSSTGMTPFDEILAMIDVALKLRPQIAAKRALTALT
jgi:hypothetical protein